MLAYLTGLDPSLGSAITAMALPASAQPAVPPTVGTTSLPPDLALQAAQLRCAANANSAACLLSLSDFPAAAAAASRALTEQPWHSKALYRRARARAALGDITGAEEDITAIERLYAEAGAAAKAAAAGASHEDVVAAAAKARGDKVAPEAGTEATKILPPPAGASSSEGSGSNGKADVAQLGPLPPAVVALGKALRAKIAASDEKFKRGFAAKVRAKAAAAAAAEEAAAAAAAEGAATGDAAVAAAEDAAEAQAREGATEGVKDQEEK